MIKYNDRDLQGTLWFPQNMQPDEQPFAIAFAPNTSTNILIQNY